MNGHVDVQCMFMANRSQTESIACVVLVALVLVPWNRIYALEAPNRAQQPGAMVRQCVENLMQQMRAPRPVRFQERTDAPWGSEVRDVVLTTEGRVDRLIAMGDQPLTAAQQKREVARLNSFLQKSAGHPLTREQDEEQQRRLKLVAAIPKAFSYQTSAAKEPGIEELIFSPAGDFRPESRETRIYQGMRGVMRLDTQSEQLLHVDGEIFRNVPFGWGILGKLHRGGHFRIDQRQVLPGRWEITETDFDFTYTVFFFSTRHYVRRTSNAAYATIDPGTRLTEAIQILLTEPSIPLPRDNFTGRCTSPISPGDNRAEGQNASTENNRRPPDRFPSCFSRSQVVGRAVPPSFREIPHWRAAPGNTEQLEIADGKRGLR